MPQKPDSVAPATAPDTATGSQLPEPHTPDEAHNRGRLSHTVAVLGNWQEAFLQALREGRGVANAALLAGVTRQMAHKASLADPAFAEAVQDALESLADNADAAVYTRGVVGVERPVYSGGEQIGTQRIYNDTLLVPYLKAKRPGEWDRARQVEHKVEGNVTLIQELKVTMTVEQIEYMVLEMEAKALPPGQEPGDKEPEAP